MLLTILEGAVTGASLIVAIGMQNIFVLTRGIKGERPYLVAFICSFCDTILIFLGVIITGSIVAMHPLAKEIAAIAGAIFLSVYGCQSLSAAVKNNYDTSKITGGSVVPGNALKTITVTLGITLLNPHVYLDTVLLLGSIAGQAGEQGKYYFATGASLFSWIWFFILAAGGKRLAPVFKRKYAWRVLDVLVCLIMWAIAYKLVQI
ncbi:MAG: LysE family transporter [Desulfotalea sp.]